MGVMYVRGLGVPKDYKESARWFKSAAEQGNAGAQFEVGMMYYKGEGVSSDLKESARWFKLAADQGNKQAKKALVD